METLVVGDSNEENVERRDFSIARVSKSSFHDRTNHRQIASSLDSHRRSVDMFVIDLRLKADISSTFQNEIETAIGAQGTTTFTKIQK